MEKIERRVARGKIFRDGNIASVTLIVDYTEDDLDPVYCTIIPDEKLDFYDVVQNDEHDEPFVEVTGTIHNDDDIWIPFLKIDGKKKAHVIDVGTNMLTFEGYADLYIQKTPRRNAPVGKLLECHLTIPESALFRMRSDYHNPTTNNSRPHPRPQENTGIWWNTPYGRAELVRNYSYSAKEERANTAFIEYRQCQIYLNVDLQAIGTWKDAVLYLHQGLNNVTRLLSFLCKTRIDWFDGFLKIVSDNETSAFLMARRDIHWGINPIKRERTQSSIDLLIKPDALRDGGLARMVDALESSPYKQLILRTITYLMATYEDFYIETRISLCYIAFEMLIDGLCEKYSQNMSDDEFDKLQITIKEILRSSNLNRESVSEVEAKLSELKRRSLKRKSILLLSEYAIPLEDLFPPKSNVNREFQRLIEGRNQFTHRGQISDMDKGIQDYHRLRYLVSIIILKLLDYPLDKLNEHDEDRFLAQQVKKIP